MTKTNKSNNVLFWRFERRVEMKANKINRNNKRVCYKHKYSLTLTGLSITTISDFASTGKGSIRVGTCSIIVTIMGIQGTFINVFLKKCEQN
jgi:hypothetical protein